MLSNYEFFNFIALYYNLLTRTRVTLLGGTNERAPLHTRTRDFRTRNLCRARVELCRCRAVGDTSMTLPLVHA